MSNFDTIFEFIKNYGQTIFTFLGIFFSTVYTIFRFAKKQFYKSKLHETIQSLKSVPDAIEEIKENNKKMYSQIKLHNNVVTTILDTLELAQFLCDENGLCISVNRHWVNLTGMSENEAEGNNWIVSVHQEDRERIRNRWHQLIENSSPFDEIFRYEHCITHAVTKVRCTAKEIRNENKERIFVIGLSKVVN